MIAKFHKTDRGLALAIVLLAGLAVVTLTDAQNQTQPQPSKTGELDTSKGVWTIRSDYWQSDTNKHQVTYTYFGHVHVDGPQMKLASERLTVDRWPSGERITAETNVVIDSGTNHITCDRAVYAYTVQNGVTNGTMTTTGHVKLTSHLDASKGVWAVRFEPVGDFSPKTPSEFLSRIPVYSGQHGEIGYFRTKKQGDKLAGSFLAYDGDQLKAALDALPGIKVTSVEKLTQEQLADYEKSPQESLIDFNENLDVSKGVWAVRFEPVGDFSPKTPGEFLSRIHVYSGQHGEIGYFRTKKQGDKLVGSFLAYDGDQLKAALDALPDIKVTTVEKLTQEQLVEYEKLPQESLVQTTLHQAAAGPTDTRLGSKVKYTSEQASVQDIVQNLAEQVGLRYDWQKSFTQTDPLCRQWVRNVDIEGKTCAQALEQILKPVGLRYQVENGVLVLSR